MPAIVTKLRDGEPCELSDQWGAANRELHDSVRAEAGQPAFTQSSSVSEISVRASHEDLRHAERMHREQMALMRVHIFASNIAQVSTEVDASNARESIKKTELVTLEALRSPSASETNDAEEPSQVLPLEPPPASSLPSGFSEREDQISQDISRFNVRSALRRQEEERKTLKHARPSWEALVSAVENKNAFGDPEHAGSKDVKISSQEHSTDLPQWLNDQRSKPPTEEELGAWSRWFWSDLWGQSYRQRPRPDGMYETQWQS